MRTLHQWLGQYAESHRDPRNKRIHWVCVPLIVWSVCALLWSVPVAWLGLPAGSVALMAAVLALGFYLALSRRLALWMALFFGLNLLICAALARVSPALLLWLALGVFVVAWIAQFIGHELEGRKPSFLTDLAFLLIGPAWVAQQVAYRSGRPL